MKTTPRPFNKVLVVDDNPSNRELLEAYLAPEGYEVIFAENGREALDRVHAEEPDIVLLDIMMPGVDGYEVCSRLKSSEQTRFIPVVMVTALKEMEDKVRALDVGADDFLTKPVQKVELLARVRSLIRVKHLHDDLESNQSVLFSLASAVEAKDPYTHGHSERVASYAVALAATVGIAPSQQQLLRKACLLHDIGKIGVPEAILRKEGPLTTLERILIQDHPVIGERICRPLKSALNYLPVIRHHHERWDGKGYPDGLAGRAIPFEARITAIADTYDALRSDRPYRKGKPPGEALRIISEEAGRQFDPLLVPRFVELMREGGP